MIFPLLIQFPGQRDSDRPYGGYGREGGERRTPEASSEAAPAGERKRLNLQPRSAPLQEGAAPAPSPTSEPSAAAVDSAPKPSEGGADGPAVGGAYRPPAARQTDRSGGFDREAPRGGDRDGPRGGDRDFGNKFGGRGGERDGRGDRPYGGRDDSGPRPRDGGRFGAFGGDRDGPRGGPREDGGRGGDRRGPMMDRAGPVEPGLAKEDTRDFSAFGERTTPSGGEAGGRFGAFGRGDRDGGEGGGPAGGAGRGGDGGRFGRPAPGRAGPAEEDLRDNRFAQAASDYKRTVAAEAAAAAGPSEGRYFPKPDGPAEGGEEGGAQPQSSNLPGTSRWGAPGGGMGMQRGGEGSAPTAFSGMRRGPPGGGEEGGMRMGGGGGGERSGNWGAFARPEPRDGPAGGGYGGDRESGRYGDRDAGPFGGGMRRSVNQPAAPPRGAVSIQTRYNANIVDLLAKDDKGKIKPEPYEMVGRGGVSARETPSAKAASSSAPAKAADSAASASSAPGAPSTAAAIRAAAALGEDVQYATLKVKVLKAAEDYLTAFGKDAGKKSAAEIASLCGGDKAKLKYSIGLVVGRASALDAAGDRKQMAGLINAFRTGTKKDPAVATDGEVVEGIEKAIAVLPSDSETARPYLFQCLAEAGAAKGGLKAEQFGELGQALLAEKPGAEQPAEDAPVDVSALAADAAASGVSWGDAVDHAGNTLKPTTAPAPAPAAAAAPSPGPSDDSDLVQVAAPRMAAVSDVVRGLVSSGAVGADLAAQVKDALDKYSKEARPEAAGAIMDEAIKVGTRACACVSRDGR